MISPRRAHDRFHDPRFGPKLVMTFDPRAPGDGYGALAWLNELHLRPGTEVPVRTAAKVERFTYVREGSLVFARSGLIQAGEFQRSAAPPQRDVRAAPRAAVHLFQLGLRAAPGEALEPGSEQRRFSAAERHGGLCLIAAPDARRGSLRVGCDVRIFSALLDRGQHVVHPLGDGRGAWLHVVDGEVALFELVLTTGDGAAIEAEYAVSFVAREVSEVLLIESAAQPAPSK